MRCVAVQLQPGRATLHSVLHVSQPVDNGFHVTQPGTYELVLNLTVQAPPTASPMLSEAIASKPADVVDIWKTRFAPLEGGPTYNIVQKERG